MVIASLGGGSPTAGSCLGRARGQAQLLHAAVFRVGLYGHRNRSCITGGDHRASTPARRSYTLTSDATVTGADLRSADLNDMCTLQLGLLYQLLSRTGNNYSSMRCTVYARNFTSVGLGQVKLVRVAQFPVIPGQGDDLPTQQQLLLHTEQSWALQGGSAAVDPSAMIEDCLRHREVVALPSSSCLVFPLVDCAVLVGLLVVELEAAATAGSGPSGAGAQAGGSGEVAVAGSGAAAAAVAAGLGPAGALPPVLAAAEGGGLAQQQQQQQVGECDAALEQELEQELERGLCPVEARPRRSLSDEELQCLRLAVPLLAKACGMDARASWQLAQSSVSTAAARGLLREAQRPLSTLNTFGAMLLPRLKDGDPDKDMAKGILVQGKRLQDLMWQLEDALHGPGAAPPPSLGGLGSAGAAPQPSMSVAVSGMVGPQHTTLPAPPFRSPSALPRDPSPAVQELLSLPPPRPAALPAASHPQHQQQHQATSGDSFASSSTDAPAGGSAPDRGPPPVSPGRVTFVDRSSDSTASIPSTSSLDGGDAFTIRQPPAQSPASASGRTAPPASGELATVASGLRSGTQHHHHHGHGHGHGASTATIDVEMDGCEPRKSGLGARSGGAAAWGWGPAYLQGAGGGGGGQLAASAAAAAVSTNLAAALAGVLTAAYRLAAVSGIGFIVNSPLSAVLPRRTKGGSNSKPRPPAPALAAAAVAPPSPPRAVAGDVDGKEGAGDGPGPRLIPRPARPLLVGVQAVLVQRVVGYMVDIALQCTPRGGQVCVSARQDGAGVQVQVLHSGRMDLQRLHVRSRSMAHTAAAAATHHASAAAAAASPAAAMHGSGGASVAVATRQVTQPAVASGGGGGQVGSGVLSVQIAQELAQQAGGHLTVSYPFNMVNARNGSLDVGTSVEIWLPGPGAAN